MLLLHMIKFHFYTAEPRLMFKYHAVKVRRRQQWRIQLWAVRAAAPFIDQNLGLALAARLRHGGKFSVKSFTFGHFFV